MIHLISIMMAVLTFGSSGLLEKMQGKIASMGAVRVVVNVQGTNASVVTDGSRYHMESDVMDVWCDGTDQWIHNGGSGEITVTEADTESADIFANPASVLTSRLLDAYSVVSEQNSSVSLKARKNVKVSYPQITIKVGADCLPQTISLKSASGEVFDLKIISIKAVSSLNADMFRPSSELLGELFLNDMR